MGFYLPHQIISPSCYLVNLFWTLEAQGLRSCCIVTSFPYLGGSHQRGRFPLLTALALYLPTLKPKVGVFSKAIGFEDHFDLIS